MYRDSGLDSQPVSTAHAPRCALTAGAALSESVGCPNLAGADEVVVSVPGALESRRAPQASKKTYK